MHYLNDHLYVVSDAGLIDLNLGEDEYHFYDVFEFELEYENYEKTADAFFDEVPVVFFGELCVLWCERLKTVIWRSLSRMR